MKLRLLITPECDRNCVKLKGHKIKDNLTATQIKEVKAANVLAYAKRYEALFGSGIVNDHVGRHSVVAEDRFRVYCFQKVWSTLKHTYTDRSLQFAVALLTTSDDNLKLDDPIMARVYEEWKTHERGLRASRKLGLTYRELRKRVKIERN